ncbi:MAG: Crp/Fnr family transcriptional regulator [Chloroflexi bacterium]|nr:Crp/Fnr family transcriptional regulator [Chloroflexota bacterium]
MPLHLDARQETKRVEFLRAVAPFTTLTDADLLTLCRDFKPRAFKKDEMVFHQGDAGEEIYVVVSGKVRVFRLAASGNETTIDIFSAGKIFGEFAPLDNQDRSASAQALEASTLLRITKQQFLAHLRVMPDLALGVIRLIIAKARWTTDFAESLAQYDAAGRLLHILLHYKDRFGQELEPGKRYRLDLNLTQSDLASLVGVKRGWINHLLQEWDKRGLIQYRAGTILILDLPRVLAERDSRIEVTAAANW